MLVKNETMGRRSLMKRRGPRTEPGGTPVVTGSSLETKHIRVTIKMFFRPGEGCADGDMSVEKEV